MARKPGPKFISFTLGFSQGVMMRVSLDELLPAAKSFRNEHIPILVVIIGAVVMAASLWPL